MSYTVPLKQFQQQFNPEAYEDKLPSFKDIGKEINLRVGTPQELYHNKDFGDWDKHNKIDKQFHDAQYQVTADEVTAIKTTIQHVLRNTIKSPKYINVRNIGKGVIKWEYYNWEDVKPPRWTLDFGRGPSRKTAKKSNTLNLVGMDYDFHLTMPQMDLYANNNRKVKFEETLLQGNLVELTESLARYREWVINRGSDVPNMTDGGLTGLLNNASVTDPGALGQGGDDDLTAAGDVLDAATVCASELILDKFEPPFTLMMSPGVFAQALQNKEGTPKVSDMELINDLGRKEGTPIFDNIIMNPFMDDSATETNSDGIIAALKVDNMNFEVVESYPLGYYPMPSVDLGVDGKILWCGGSAVYRPTAVVFADALTTNVFAA